MFPRDYPGSIHYRHFHTTSFIRLHEECIELFDPGDDEIEFDKEAISLVHPGKVRDGNPDEK